MKPSKQLNVVLMVEITKIRRFEADLDEILGNYFVTVLPEPSGLEPSIE